MGMSTLAAKIDDIGKPAWIGLMIVGFILFWPVGLALLAYLFWSGRMGFGQRSTEFRQEMRQRFGDIRRWKNDARSGSCSSWRDRSSTTLNSSGNRAFDEYREQTLQRLEDEQAEFYNFLDRLRQAKDRSEFDQFMTDRRNNPKPPTPTVEGSAVPPTGPAS
jgi:Protein of unknown function (DUF2852)